MHYVHKKARCDPEIATFRTKNYPFLPGLRLNWLVKIDFRGSRGPWSLILLFATGVSLKETETEETIGFFGTFLSLVKFQFGGRSGWLSLYMLQLRKTKKVFANFPRGFWRIPTKFQRFKNSAVLEPKTGQSWRT